MVPAKYFMNKISDYLERKYKNTKDDKNSQFDVRWNKEHTTFYIYNRKSGRPICSATLRFSDHSPYLPNYMNPSASDFNYPSEKAKHNVSIEFYDPNHRFERTTNIRNSYDFDVERYMYATKNLEKEDINKIIVNAMSFIEEPYSKFEDPFKDDPKKKAYTWQARAYKAQVPFPLPRKSVYDGPMNYFDVVHGSSRRNESENNVYEYIFVCYNDSLDVKEEAEKFINSEMKKRQMYESVMREISVIVKNEIFNK